MAELKRCKKCGKISSWNSYFDGYICECGNIERKATTNADRIRAMTDEELSVFLWEFEKEKIARSTEYALERRKITEWLKQPAE